MKAKTGIAFTLVITTIAAARERPVSVQFVNVAAMSGIVFRHESGSSAEKFLPETMGGGAVVFDYDNDGWPDIFLVNSGSFIDARAAAKARHRLYRNNRNGTFTDATALSGIGVSGYGMGACSADYDNDGWDDLFVTSFGENRLYRNTGGRFMDVTATAGVESQTWSASCAFGDVDNDGYVDLYVTNYLDFDPAQNKYCGDHVKNIRTYCPPNVYPGVSDVLYHNDQDGSFTDIGRRSGISTPEGKGLGVVFSDYDRDGWLDIYVANDSVRNFLFHNKGKGIFEEVGLPAGVAVNASGQPLSGMGADAADADGDGLPDIFVTNLDRQTHTLYRNAGNGLFTDVTFESGIGEATLPFVGFGAVFLDYDNDTDLDLAVVNGDVLDNARYFRDTASYAQRNLLLTNDGAGRFVDDGLKSGPGFSLKKVSRALAAADLDNDGDLDLVIANNGQPADLLRNDGGNRNNSMLIRLIGSESNRDGIGARLTLSVGGKALVREVKAGSSYLSQSDLRVHFGLGQARRSDRLEVAWPSGRMDVLRDLEGNQILTVSEGRGVTDRARIP